MRVLLAGMASGTLMALIFVTVSVLVLVRAARGDTPSSALAGLFDQVPPVTVTLGVVLLAYPVWGIVGMLLAVAYALVEKGLPGASLGSPNGAFTLAVLGVTGLMALPVVFFVQGIRPHLLALLLGFLGVFGWFLPHFAAG